MSKISLNREKLNHFDTLKRKPDREKNFSFALMETFFVMEHKKGTLKCCFFYFDMNLYTSEEIRREKRDTWGGANNILKFL